MLKEENERLKNEIVELNARIQVQGQTIVELLQVNINLKTIETLLRRKTEENEALMAQLRKSVEDLKPKTELVEVK